MATRRSKKIIPAAHVGPAHLLMKFEGRTIQVGVRREDLCVDASGQGGMEIRIEGLRPDPRSPTAPQIRVVADEQGYVTVTVWDGDAERRLLVPQD